MRLTSLAFVLFCAGFLVVSCGSAGGLTPTEEPLSGAGAGGAAAGASGAAGGVAAGQGGSAAGVGVGAAGGGVAGGGGKAGGGGNSPFGGGGKAGGPFGGGGEAGGSAFGGGGGASGDAGSGAGGAGDGGASGAAGMAGSGAAPGWTCGESSYKSGGPSPACNCGCGVRDPDCDDPNSYLKGCDTGQTCGQDGTCQGAVLFPPASWVCGSAYYGIGGPVPECNCGCGAPDPDCDLPHPTFDLTRCKTGQTCGKDGTCQGPELMPPASWTCKASKFAEGKTSGTCDCGCGAPDPDCADTHLKITGCGFQQTCDAAGQCAGPIGPAPAGWMCDNAAYSDGKLCNCACGVRDPDCDLDLPDTCAPDGFCGSITNDCIPLAN